MSDTPKRIGVLYSRGPHLLRLLHFLRATYPGAKIILFVPENYPQKHVLPLVSKVKTFPESGAFSQRLLLLKEARNTQTDTFVIMFPSVKLRTFAKLSGARQGQYLFSVSGEFLAIKMNLPQELLCFLQQRARGFLNYLRIRQYIARHKIGK